LEYTGRGRVAIDNYFMELRELGVTDSKKLSQKKRKKILADLEIDTNSLKSTFFERKNFSFSYAIREVSPTLIDEINILNASLKAMAGSFTECHQEGSRGRLLIDGNKIPRELPLEVKAEAIIKGDSKSLLIGLASIIAKEYRDDLMEKMAEDYPGYGFEAHAGYPTIRHREAIEELGITPIHRLSFKGVREFA
jgi:ribonuclease HII